MLPAEIRNNTDENGMPTGGRVRIAIGAHKAQTVLNINWQAGPIKEHGVNGVQIEDVLEAARQRLEFLNVHFHSEENDNALSYISSAQFWLNKRTARREQQGVEGTNETGDGDTVYVSPGDVALDGSAEDQA